MKSINKLTRLLLQSLIVIWTLLAAGLAEIYLNEWAVEIEGGPEHASHVASSLGFTSKGQIGAIKDHYVFVHHHIEKRSLYSSHHHTGKLTSHPQIIWSEQQISKKRVKRDYLNPEEESFSPNPNTYVPSYNPHFRDPDYQKQWYLHGGASGHNDMNVLEAWRKGYTGAGVVVTILDDGIERKHSDLVQNYDPRASFDINSNDDDPTPRYDLTNENRHGTRCAGEVASSANNTKCGVGIAYDASIGGVRMLDGDVSDVVEAQSLSMNRDHIDIYSASWGPDDNGKVVDGPARLAWKAFIDGVTFGRHGKGNIFVWASGNGGSEEDSCNCDGYTNSIYTLSISSVSENNHKPWYLEECSSTLASTYSSGASYTERQIVTTDLRDRCTESHTGTSASAPLAAGICALALQANPGLGWRDMQHIVVMTARPIPVAADGEWVTNGVNRNVSLRYGYGLMDAGAMVSLAERWTPVPAQRICTAPILDKGTPISGRRTIVYTVSDGCYDSPSQSIRYLEHVQARISLDYSRRGNLQIFLVSPNGTRTTLLPKRRKDFSSGSFNNWPFMSVHFWGENPIGQWKLVLENHDDTSNYGNLRGWQLVFYGTSSNPVNLREPRGRPNTPPKQEYDCDRECKDGCYGPKPTDCINCKHFRKFSNGPCVHECEEREFADPVTSLCIPCHSSCLGCQGPAINDCVDCRDGILLVEQAGQCRAGCPDGYYADTEAGVCRQCHYPCVTCHKAADECTACPEELQLDAQLSQCIFQCRINQYRDNDGKCSRCDSVCGTCSGPSPRDCIRCPTGSFYLNGTCVQDCGVRFFSDQDFGECQSCHPVCLRCNGAQSHDCTQCRHGDRLSDDGICQSSGPCPPDHLTSPSGDCIKCHPTCKRCHGESRWACTACITDRVYDSGQCISTSCGAGYYEVRITDRDGSTLRRCEPCHRNCRQCSGGSDRQCVSCSHDKILADGQCRSQCEHGYYHSASGRCDACHPSCDSCTGSGIRNCATCRARHYMHSGLCLEQCPQGNFPSHQNKCLRCYHTCTACSCECCLPAVPVMLDTCYNKVTVSVSAHVPQACTTTYDCGRVSCATTRVSHVGVTGHRTVLVVLTCTRTTPKHINVSRVVLTLYVQTAVNVTRGQVSVWPIVTLSSETQVNPTAPSGHNTPISLPILISVTK